MQNPYKVTSFLGEPISSSYRTLTTKAPGCTLPTKEEDYEKNAWGCNYLFYRPNQHN